MIIVSFDPGAKTGFCIREDSNVLMSGIEDRQKAVEVVRNFIEPAVPDIVVIEGAYVPNASMGYISGILKLCKTSGFIEGYCYAYWRDALVWRPLSTQWRSVLGLRPKNRDEAKEVVLAWAEAHVGRKIEGPRGGSAYDEAEAIAMGAAAFIKFLN